MSYMGETNCKHLVKRIISAASKCEDYRNDNLPSGNLSVHCRNSCKCSKLLVSTFLLYALCNFDLFLVTIPEFIRFLLESRSHHYPLNLNT